jgi:hypothetical protein
MGWAHPATPDYFSNCAMHKPGIGPILLLVLVTTSTISLTLLTMDKSGGLKNENLKVQNAFHLLNIYH